MPLKYDSANDEFARRALTFNNPELFFKASHVFLILPKMMLV